MEKILNIKNFLKNKNILITGNTGFIGSWLSLVLIDLKANIIGISKDLGDQKGLFKLLKVNKKIIFYKKNLVYSKISKIISDHNIHIIIHLAAEPLVYDGFKSPHKVIKNNIMSTLNLIDSIKRRKILFLNFTTDKVYENKGNKIEYFTEKRTLKGEDPYSFSKVTTDMLTEMWSKYNKNIKFINIRCGNVVGGCDWKKKRIISDLVRSYFENQKLVLRNLSATRPWIHVLEVCNILLLLIHKNYKMKSNFQSYNISPDIVKKETVSVLKVINFFEKHFNYKFSFSKKKEFPERKYLNLNSIKIKKFLKLNYNFSTFERFKLTFEWYADFYEKKNIKDTTQSNIEKVKYFFYYK